MLFSPLHKNVSIKRQRETQLVEERRFKRSSPTPSEIELSIETGAAARHFDISTPIKDVFKKCSTIHRSRNRKRDLQRREICNATPPITPESSPTKGSGLYWESKRIQSTGQLAISSPLSEKPQSLSQDFAHLSLSLTIETESLADRLAVNGKPHEIFLVKEILENIIKFVSLENEIPHERSYSRRKPLSYNHALLIYKDEKKANQVWKDCSESEVVPMAPRTSNHLYSCLMVNKLWHSVTVELLLKKIYFKDPKHFNKFVEKYSASSGRLSRPSIFVLHKFHRLLQADLDKITSVLVPDDITWLEFYICPNIVPPLSWISNFKSLEKLILPGNKAINDNFLIEIATHITGLKALDLRACDNITDSGVVAIALRCPTLKNCNLGRHRNGENITSVSLVALAKHTQIETLGVAGCEITDAGIWELAQLRGEHIKRLSLNNCNLLTNHSIPALFALNYFPNLSVLEIRNIHQINDLRQLAQFKSWKRTQRVPVLIEGCERITKLLSDEEEYIKRKKARIALQDMEYWANKDDD